MTWLVVLAWTVAILGSVGYLAAIGLKLLRQLKELNQAAQPLVESVSKLAAVTASIAEIEKPHDNLQDSPLEHAKTVFNQQMARKRRSADRQRRLINRLKP